MTGKDVHTIGLRESKATTALWRLRTEGSHRRQPCTHTHTVPLKTCAGFPVASLAFLAHAVRQLVCTWISKAIEADASQTMGIL